MSESYSSNSYTANTTAAYRVLLIGCCLVAALFSEVAQIVSARLNAIYHVGSFHSRFREADFFVPFELWLVGFILCLGLMVGTEDLLSQLVSFPRSMKHRTSLAVAQLLCWVTMCGTLGYVGFASPGMWLAILGALPFGYVHARHSLRQQPIVAAIGLIRQADYAVDEFESLLKPAEETLKELESRQEPYGDVLARSIVQLISRTAGRHEQCRRWCDLSMDYLQGCGQPEMVAELVKKARAVLDKIASQKQRLDDLALRLDKFIPDRPEQSKDQTVGTRTTVRGLSGATLFCWSLPFADPATPPGSRETQNRGAQTQMLAKPEDGSTQILMKGDEQLCFMQS